jgi:phage N-6-adenine-methyltransferase
MPSIEWETPQEFFDKVNSEFAFTIDVCATKENTKCSKFITKEQDSLSKKWNGVCWMNPPYNRDIGKWMAKAYETAQTGSTVVALIQGRSNDTIWWHDYVMRSSEIRFIKDRLHFGLNGKFRRGNISSVLVIFYPFCQGPPSTMSINIKGQPLNNQVQQTASGCF